MKTPAPIYRLKRAARALSHKLEIPLHEALDRIAQQEGYGRWSLLSSAVARPASKLFAALQPGDMVLLGARPGHGKTLMSLELAVEAMKAGHQASFFTLEYTQRDVLDRFRAIGAEPARFERLFRFDDSDLISADYIQSRLFDAPHGSLVVVDYLQLLDQRRDNPALDIQVRTLERFARQRGLILIFISQIDRSYDSSAKPLPDMRDIRLPNPVDLSLFSKTCFLNNGEIVFQTLR